jgi:hypothetical protein
VLGQADPDPSPLTSELRLVLPSEDDACVWLGSPLLPLILKDFPVSSSLWWVPGKHCFFPPPLPSLPFGGTWFDIRASHLQGRSCTISATLPILLPWLLLRYRVSRFAWAGLNHDPLIYASLSSWDVRHVPPHAAFSVEMESHKRSS